MSSFNPDAPSGGNDGDDRGRWPSRVAVVAVVMTILMVVSPVGMAAGAMGATPDGAVAQQTAAGDLLPAADSPAEAQSDPVEPEAKNVKSQSRTVDSRSTTPVEELVEPTGGAAAASQPACSGEMTLDDQEWVLEGSLDSSFDDDCAFVSFTLPLPVQEVMFDLDSESVGSGANFDLFVTLDGRMASPVDYDRANTTDGVDAALRFSGQSVPDSREFGVGVKAYSGNGPFSVDIEFVLAPPLAQFEAAPAREISRPSDADARPNEKLRLDAEYSIIPNASYLVDAEGETTYRWDLTGDGEYDTETDESVVYTDFEEKGAHDVTLEVEGPRGYTDTRTQTIQVAGERVPDVVANLDVLADRPVWIRDEFQMTAERSYSNEEWIDSYAWYIDGDFVGEGETISHEFEDPGTYEVKVEAHDHDAEGSPGVATTMLEVEEPAIFIHDVEQNRPWWNPFHMFAGCGPAGKVEAHVVGSEDVEKVYFEDTGGELFGEIDNPLTDRSGSGDLDQQDGEVWALRRQELGEDAKWKRLYFGDKTIKITAVGEEGSTYSTTYQTDVSQIPEWVGSALGGVSKEATGGMTEFVFGEAIPAKISGCAFEVTLFGDGGSGAFDMSLIPDQMLDGGAAAQKLPYMDSGDFRIAGVIEYKPAPHQVKTSIETTYGDIDIPPGESSLDLGAAGRMLWDPDGGYGPLWELMQWQLEAWVSGEIDITDIVLAAVPPLKGSYPTGPLAKAPKIPGRINMPWGVFLTAGINLRATLDDPDGLKLPDPSDAVFEGKGDLGLKLQLGWDELYDGLIQLTVYGGIEYRLDWIQLIPFDPELDGALFAYLGAEVAGSVETGLPLVGKVSETILEYKKEFELLDWPSPMLRGMPAGGAATGVGSALSVPGPSDGQASGTGANETSTSSGEEFVASMAGGE